jgi:F-type H+-transporting ATPase subunit b
MAAMNGNNMAAQPKATTAEVGHDEGGHQAFPPFETSTFPSQLLWLAIIFGGLYYVMSKIALPKVGAVIATRKARIARDLDDAADMQKKADEAAAAHEKVLADAKLRAQALAQEQRDKLTAEADVRRKSVEADLAAKLAAAEQQIETSRSQAMSNVEGIARDAASAIYERVLGRPANPDAIASAVVAAKSGAA